MSYQIGQKVWFLYLGLGSNPSRSPYGRILTDAEPTHDHPSIGENYFERIIALEMYGMGEITQTGEFCFTGPDGHAWKTCSQLAEYETNAIEPVKPAEGRDFVMFDLKQFLEGLLCVFFNPSVREMDRQKASSQYSEILFHLQKEYGLTISRPSPAKVEIQRNAVNHVSLNSNIVQQG